MISPSEKKAGLVILVAALLALLVSFSATRSRLQIGRDRAAAQATDSAHF